MSHNWVRANAYSGAPVDGVIAGHDIDGATIYVGRAYHEGDLIPAKVMPSKQVAYVPYAGSEVAKHEFEILTGTGYQWVSSGSGHVPVGAVCAGNQSNGEQLFVGRAHVGGSLTTGKVHPSHHCIYVPFNGTEHTVRQYEVLIRPQLRSQWVPTTNHSPLPAGAVLGGHDQDGSQLYVGRAWHGGDQIPAKVLPTKHACYIAYGGQEVPKDSFEVLCHGNVQWVKCNPRSRSVPPMSLTAGATSEGEPLYIGRAHYNGSLTVGKVQISHGALYISFGGQEIPIHSEIEVLVEH